MCVAKVILLAETKKHGPVMVVKSWQSMGGFPLFGAFLDVKKAHLLMEEIRKKSGWKHHEL